MKLLALVAMLAMIPAAINPAVAATPASMTIAVATCAGKARLLILPIGNGRPAPADQPPCCNKGCHGSSCRKRSSGAI